jgi:hypothetical protein
MTSCYFATPFVLSTNVKTSNPNFSQFEIPDPESGPETELSAHVTLAALFCPEERDTVLTSNVTKMSKLLLDRLLFYLRKTTQNSDLGNCWGQLVYVRRIGQAKVRLRYDNVKMRLDAAAVVPGVVQILSDYPPISIGPQLNLYLQRQVVWHGSPPF